MESLSRWWSAGVAALAGVVDLVLPAECAGCGDMVARHGVCAGCAAIIGGAPVWARPRPAPVGLPPCFAAGDYGGPLRDVILAYKERGRRTLAVPLGDVLAGIILSAWPLRDETLAVVPVPSTAAAIRARHGDHMLRLARRACVSLRGAGCPAAVAVPLRALPKADSAHLDRHQRAAGARHAFALRHGRAEPLRAVADNAAVVVVDDVLTTGSTLAAVAGRLWEVGVPVAFGVTLAATRLRGGEP